MAEINDIAFKMTADIAALIVPLVGSTYAMPEYIDANGASQPTADAQAYPGPRTVPPVTIFPSRPMLTDLTNRMGLGKASISIECATHDVPRKQFCNKPEEQVSNPAATLTAAQSDYTVTLGGPITPGNVIGLQSGNAGTSYLVKQGDTVDSIAAGLAAAAPADGFFPIAAFAGGFTVDAPTDAQPLIVTIGTTSTWIRPVQYRRRNFDALVWTSNPYDRQFLGRALETLYDLGQRLPMTDGSVATVMDCLGPIDHDGETPENVYVRRIRWSIDFISVKTFTKTTIVAANATLDPVPFGTDLADYTAPTASQL